jgi:hypothetical protein
MGLAAAADLFRVFVIVLVSRFALVDSEDRFHGVPLVTFIAARIASRLAEPLHGQSPLRTISGPGDTDLEPIEGRPGGQGRAAPRAPALPSQPLNIRFFARKM